MLEQFLGWSPRHKFRFADVVSCEGVYHINGSSVGVMKVDNLNVSYIFLYAVKSDRLSFLTLKNNLKLWEGSLDAILMP